MSLGEAIDAIRNVYAKERRGRFPRLSLATHLGYSSINGRSLSKMGGLRAYGLIEGREDSLVVSSVALAIMEAPEGSPDRTIQAYLDSLELINSKAGGHLSTSPLDQPVQPQHPTKPAPIQASRPVKAYTEAPRAAYSQEPDFKISLGGGRWLLIEVKGGEPTEQDFVKLEKFARFQRELLADDEWGRPDNGDVEGELGTN
jgi:hypothetical protein